MDDPLHATVALAGACLVLVLLLASFIAESDEE
jgi:hypothetical protein